VSQFSCNQLLKSLARCPSVESPSPQQRGGADTNRNNVSHIPQEKEMKRNNINIPHRKRNFSDSNKPE
jgi:hypothetical protein